jgi:hypothetical protein
MVLLLRVLVIRQVYTPEAFLKALSIVTTASSLGTTIPRESRIWVVVIAGIFLGTQVILSSAPSRTVTSSKKGSLRTAQKTKKRIPEMIEVLPVIIRTVYAWSTVILYLCENYL